MSGARSESNPRYRTVASAFGALALAAVFLLASGPQAHAACSNEAIREAQVSEALPGGSTFLPDCMALEMVTPPKKFNQTVAQPGISPNGERVKFASVAALAETPKQGSITDPYIATRSGSGWSTQPTASPPRFAFGSAAAALPCSYSPDLSHWTLFGSTSPQGPLGITTAFRGTLGGGFEPLSPTLVPRIQGVGRNAINNAPCLGASVDATHEFISVNDAIYLPGDPVPGIYDPDNVYEAYLGADGTPSVRLLQRDAGGNVYGGRCGAFIGGRPETVTPAYRGAISPDASRVYFTTRPGQGAGDCDQSLNKERVMLRLDTPGGIEITELAPSECDRVSPPCSTADGDDTFLGASQEGGKVYFSTTRQLADSDLDTTADLYLYDSSLPAGERLIQVSAGDPGAPSPGAGAEVLGLADFAGDGSRAYFVAKGVLSTAANAEGATAQAGQPNLYLYQRDGAHPGGHTAFIGTLDPGDSHVWRGGAGLNEAAAVPTLGADPEDQSLGGDGRLFAFFSHASLTPEDTDGGSADVYRYDSESGQLLRISAAAPGGSDNGAADVRPSAESEGVGPQALFLGRWISEDGNTIAFAGEEGLDPADTNGAENSYIWHAGSLTALPFGSEATVSMSGQQIAFVTEKRLLPADGDSARDVYVARAGGGYPIVPPPPPCQGEACQGSSAAPPALLGVASQALRAGNPHRAPRCRKGAVRRRGACRCRKGAVRRRGRCVRKRHAKKRGHRRHHRNHKHRKQGGRK